MRAFAERALILAAIAGSATACEEEKAFEAWRLPIIDLPGVFPFRPWSMTKDGDGVLWFGGQGGLVRYDPRTEHWRTYDTFGPIYDVAWHPNVGLFSSSGDGLLAYDPAPDRWFVRSSTVPLSERALPRLSILRSGLLVRNLNGRTSIYETADRRRDGVTPFPAEFCEESEDSRLWCVGMEDHQLRVGRSGEKSFELVGSSTRSSGIAIEGGQVWLSNWDASPIVYGAHDRKLDVSRTRESRLAVGRVVVAGSDVWSTSRRGELVHWLRSSRTWEVIRGAPPFPEILGADRELWLISGAEVTDQSRQRRYRIAGLVMESEGVFIARGPTVPPTFGSTTLGDNLVLWDCDQGFATHLGRYYWSFSPELARVCESGRTRASKRNFLNRPSNTDLIPVAATQARNGDAWMLDERENGENELYFCRSTMICEKESLAGLRAIHAATDGTFWFATANNLGRVKRRGEQADRVDLAGIWMFAESESGELWAATRERLFRIAQPLMREGPSIKAQVIWMRFDGKDRLWTVERNESSKTWLTIYDRAAREIARIGIDVPLSEDLFFQGHSPIDVDGLGRLLYNRDTGIMRQEWLGNGVPKRAVTHPYLARFPRLMTTSESASELHVWRTRLTGLLTNTATSQAVFEYPERLIAPTVLTRAPEGGIWLGTAGAGVHLYESSGHRIGFSTKEGLPDEAVLDISPAHEAATAWVATNDGAARVSAVRVEISVPGLGPVDQIAAHPDGGAWIAMNPIDKDLYFDKSKAGERARTELRRITAAGKIEDTVTRLPSGTITDLQMDPDDDLLWIATTAGLYKIGPNGKLFREDAGGRLPESAIDKLLVDPKGTVWMAASASGDTEFAGLTAYSRGRNDITSYGPSRGLQQAKRIDGLGYTGDGEMIVLAGSSLSRGGRQPRDPGNWIMAIVVCFGLVLATAAYINDRRQREAQRRLYQPMLDVARSAFSSLGRSVTGTGVRVLALSATEREPETFLYCVLDDVVSVEQVKELFKGLSKVAVARAYLLHRRDLDPAALWQLDEYRLRQATVIIPLAVGFLRAKAAEGVDSLRAAMDDLHRRYLGTQDLFDVRNAIDEPRFFFGRRALISDILAAINRREHIALIGPRKAGKSSLLNILHQRLDAFPVAKIDFQLFNRDEDWAPDFFARIVERYDTWGRFKFGSSWSFETAEVATGTAFEAALRERRARQTELGNTQPLMLLVDEIERVFPHAGEVEQARRFNRVAGVLRALGQEGGERLISMVVADLRPTFNRRNDFGIEGVDTNPFYRFFQERFVCPLEPAECEEMLKELAQAMGLQLEETVRRRIIDDSGGHATLARQLASAAAKQRGASVIVGAEHYRDGLAVFVEQTLGSDDYFGENFWKVSTPQERTVLSAMAMEEGASEAAVAGDDQTVIDARRSLFSVGIIEKLEGDSYRVAGALFRDWLRTLNA